MENKSDMEKLIRLNEAKEKFWIMMKKDLTNRDNYVRAKELYQEYSNIYKSITGQEPNKTFEELLQWD